MSVEGICNSQPESNTTTPIQKDCFIAPAENNGF